jgi:hypothetical protein
MTRNSVLAILLAAGASLLQAQSPQVLVDSAVNAASYIHPSYPNGGISHGGMFILFGRQPGSLRTKLADKFPLSPNMNGTSIKVTSGASSFDAAMVYVVGCIARAPDQLAAILPSSVPVGTGSVTMTYKGKTSAPIAIQVRESVVSVTRRLRRALVLAGDKPAALETLTRAVRLGESTNQDLPGNTDAQVQLLFAYDMLTQAYETWGSCDETRRMAASNAEQNRRLEVESCA